MVWLPARFGRKGFWELQVHVPTLVMSLRPFLDQAMQISEGLLQKHAQNYNESYSLTQQYAVIHKQM
jgi:hypothetical protein